MSSISTYSTSILVDVLAIYNTNYSQHVLRTFCTAKVLFRSIIAFECPERAW